MPKLPRHVQDIAPLVERWGVDMVIAIGIDAQGRYRLATYGATRSICPVAAKLGDVAARAIEDYVHEIDQGGTS